MKGEAVEVKVGMVFRKAGAGGRAVLVVGGGLTEKGALEQRVEDTGEQVCRCVWTKAASAMALRQECTGWDSAGRPVCLEQSKSERAVGSEGRRVRSVAQRAQF